VLGRRLVVPVAVAAALLLAACTVAHPSITVLRAEPVLEPLPGEVVLLTAKSPPRRARIGVAGRDGAIERVVALTAPPAEVADLLQQRFGDRYRFQRTDLGRGTPNTVELRGTSDAGIVVIATASTLRPVPLFASLGAVQAAPLDHPTSLVVTVISRQ
jgi:hypothetical protein